MLAAVAARTAGGIESISIVNTACVITLGLRLSSNARAMTVAVLSNVNGTEYRFDVVVGSAPSIV